MIIAGIAVLLVLGAGGYFGYRLRGGEGKETLAAVEPAKTAETAAVPAAAVPADATAIAGAAPPGAVEPALPTETAPESAPAVAESPLPGAAPTAVSETAPPRLTRPKAPKAAPAGTDIPPKAQAARSPGAVGNVAASASRVASAPPPDRWQLYADAIAQCQHLDLFSRIGCEQRQRWHYCEGYWGQVSQCPGAPTPDRGS